MDEEEDADLEEVIEDSPSTAMGASSFPLLREKEDIPQWIIDADKAAKKNRGSSRDFRSAK